jgi:hypothetical protein
MWLEIDGLVYKGENGPAKVKITQDVINHRFETISAVCLYLRGLVNEMEKAATDKRTGFINKIKAVVTLLER